MKKLTKIVIQIAIDITISLEMKPQSNCINCSQDTSLEPCIRLAHAHQESEV